MSFVEVTAENGGDILGGQSYGGGDMVVVAEDSVGGIEPDPSGAGKVGLSPRVEGSFRVFFRFAELAEVSADDPCGESHASEGGGHEHGEIPAGPAAHCDGLSGRTRVALLAALVDEVFVEGAVELDERGDGGLGGGRW